MNIFYTVFWISTERKIYGDDSYYVLGEWMYSCDTEDKAVEYIKSLNLKKGNNCTIVKMYSGE